MQSSLVMTALWMGLAGGPHRMAMCGLVCAGLGPGRDLQAARPSAALWKFHVGRVLGYSALGALAAVSVQSIGWVMAQSTVLRTLWMLLHLGVAGFGVVLVVSARQPRWMEDGGRRIWARVRGSRPAGAAPWAVGVLWALMPCGLLYSAVLVAAMASGPVQGAMVMTTFALGSLTSVVLGTRLWQRFGVGSSQAWAVRLAGALLVMVSLLAVGSDLAARISVWCGPSASV